MHVLLISSLVYYGRNTALIHSLILIAKQIFKQKSTSTHVHTLLCHSLVSPCLKFLHWYTASKCITSVAVYSNFPARNPPENSPNLGVSILSSKPSPTQGQLQGWYQFYTLHSLHISNQMGLTIEKNFLEILAIQKRMNNRLSRNPIPPIRFLWLNDHDEHWSL